MPFTRDEIEDMANQTVRFFAPQIRAAVRPWWADPWGAFRRWWGRRRRAQQYAALQARLEEVYRRLNVGTDLNRHALVGEAVHLLIEIGHMRLNDQLYGNDSVRPVRFNEL